MADLFDIVTARKLSGGGGGGTTVEALSVTQNGTYTAPSGKAYSPVTVNVSGGSSDFSTATITVVGGDLSAVIPIVMTTEMGAPFDALVSVSQAIPSGAQVPLYKGKLIIEISLSLNVTVSGNIESLGDGLYLITGDCTITIS